MTRKDNAFRRIFDVAGQTNSEAPALLENMSQLPEEAQPIPESESKKRGRPKGKKSSPEFVSAIAYIRKKTHLQVKRLLLDFEELGEKQDFSELVQELLDFWVLLQQGEDPEILLARFSQRKKEDSSQS